MKHKLLTASRRNFLKIGGSAVAAASLGMPALAKGKQGELVLPCPHFLSLASNTLIFRTSRKR